MIGRRGFVGFLLCGVAGLALGGCGKQGARSYHYRLVVEVETPEGLRTGSSVIGVEGSRQLPGTGALGGSGPQARGEAVAVDLPNGRTLFALLRSETDADWAGSAHIRANPKDYDDFPNADDYYQAVSRDRLAYPIKRWVDMQTKQRDNYPMLVTFTDIKDPATVQRVNADDLAASFGTGYRLKSITVQGTDDAVTTGIEKRLVWLPSAYQVLKGRDFKPDGIPVGDFQRLFSTEQN
jgi:hypothetical protein